MSLRRGNRVGDATVITELVIENLSSLTKLSTELAPRRGFELRL